MVIEIPTDKELSERCAELLGWDRAADSDGWVLPDKSDQYAKLPRFSEWITWAWQMVVALENEGWYPSVLKSTETNLWLARFGRHDGSGDLVAYYSSHCGNPARAICEAFLALRADFGKGEVP